MDKVCIKLHPKEKYMPTWKDDLIVDEYHSYSDTVTRVLELITAEEDSSQTTSLAEEDDSKDPVLDAEVHNMLLIPEEPDTKEQTEVIQEALTEIVSSKRIVKEATANQKRTCVRKMIEEIMSIYEEPLKLHSKATKVKDDLDLKDQALVNAFMERTRRHFGETLSSDQLE